MMFDGDGWCLMVDGDGNVDDDDDDDEEEDDWW